MTQEPLTMEHGEQPLHQFLENHKLSNQDLVQASPDALTHKQVQKARKGRALTIRLQRKIIRAIHLVAPETPCELDDLFTYKGR